MANRTVKWFTTLRTDQVLASGLQTTFDLLAGVAVANRKGSTVTRFLLDIWMTPDTINSRKAIDFGTVWVDSDAVVAGAFPDADVETEKVDWLMRSRMVVLGPNAGSIFLQPPMRSYDIRSQRICRADNDELRLICDINAITTGGVFITFISRVLLRLP